MASIHERPLQFENPSPTDPDDVINRTLGNHQASRKDWQFSALLANLQIWTNRIVDEFKLEIPAPALMVAPLSTRCLGHFRPGRNGFGLRNEIAIDALHVRTSEYWEVIGTLVHELLHSWQQEHGTPPKPSSWNYHNREFRRKAESLGLVVDRYGCQHYAPAPTPFTTLLDRYGLIRPDLPRMTVPIAKHSKSKLKLYECSCGVKVRIGRARFNATCGDCNSQFEFKGS
jgi:hypothetical protein